MLYDSNGNKIPPQPTHLVDPVYDPAVESSGYVLPNVRTDHLTPELRADLEREVARARADAIEDPTRIDNLDAFVNELTALGTVWGDKTKGGLAGGPVFCLNRVRGTEAETMTRGSDLGANIVNKIPDEMTREGWKIEVQPTDEEADMAGDRGALLEASKAEPARAAAAWRRDAARGSMAHAKRCYAIARRWDAFGATPPNMQPPPPPAPPGPLPKLNDEGIELARAMEKWGEGVNVVGAVNQALRYERMVGGGAVFIGVDDGETQLTRPLDPSKVRRVTHLTPLSGGWDGECVMYRVYNDMTAKKYGQPEIYQVRNLSVSLGRPPAPGEIDPVRQLVTRSPAGPTIFYVHESRLMIFDGSPTTRQAQQELRGWGDSIYTRVKEVLSQFDQTWNAVASLMQEFSIINMSIDGYSELLASRDPQDRAILLQRARDLQLLRSVARMNVIDSKDKVERMSVSIAGVPELLDGPLARRLAAAADIPVSLLFGQVIGSIGGGAGESERRSFNDAVRSKQKRRMVPQLTYLYDLVWRSSQGPSRGQVPERWSVTPNPLWQSTPAEDADNRLKTAQADEIEIRSTVVSAEEVTATRYGGAEYNPGPIVLDLEGRAANAVLAEDREAEDLPAVGEGDPDPAEVPPNATPMPTPAVDQPLYLPVPPMRPTPADPITGDPVAVPSTIGNTTGGRADQLPIALLNTTIATADGAYTVTPLTVAEARAIVGANRTVSAIGHEATAQAMGQALGVPVPVNRVEFHQAVGQVAVVLKLRGRLPEGVILTPEQLEAIGYDFKRMERTA